MAATSSRYSQQPVKKPIIQPSTIALGQGGLLRRTLAPAQPTGSANPAPTTAPPTPPVQDAVRTIQPVTPVTGEVKQPSAPTPATPPPTSDLGPDITDAETSVESRMTGLLRGDNEYMRQAEAVGRQAANRRGLGNSTMAVKAVEAERIRAALPIASQDAGQAHTERMQQRDIRSRELLSSLDRDAQERINRMNVSAQERASAAQLAASFESSYSTTVNGIMNNPELPADARQRYVEHAGKVRDSNLALVEQMYGINLDWGGGEGSAGTPQLPQKQQPPENLRWNGSKWQVKTSLGWYTAKADDQKKYDEIYSR